MSRNRAARRARRRSLAVVRALDRYHRQIEIEEELRPLLARSDSLREVCLPSNPFILSGPDMRGRWSGSAEEVDENGM